MHTYVCLFQYLLIHNAQIHPREMGMHVAQRLVRTPILPHTGGGRSCTLAPVPAAGL